MSINSNRPKVRVFDDKNNVVDSVKLPAIFKSPIRTDIVQYVHTNVAKNNRQPYAVHMLAGMGSSAESWGTGRAVARIPRVPGGGTHRAGQGAFGNMCRKGRRFAPTRIWRRWHRRVSTDQKRFAVASALAASSIAPLVQARGHRIERVREIPLVIANESIETIGTTKKALAFLKSVGALPDHLKAKHSLKVRAGKGKMRNRRYVHRRGPLIVHTLSGDAPLLRAFRNLTGLEYQRVQALNPLVLAPGGHIGRFIIWTKAAFEQLDSLFGTERVSSQTKVDYRLPRSQLTNDDITRVIKSDQVQSLLRPYKPTTHTRHPRKFNPFNNDDILTRLNPHAVVVKQQARTLQAKVLAKVAAIRKERAERKAFNKGKDAKDRKREPKRKPLPNIRQIRIARRLKLGKRPKGHSKALIAKKLAEKKAATEK